MSNHVRVTSPNLIYILLTDRAEFDTINLPCSDHGDKAERGHVLSKSIMESGKPYIIIQHWVRQPATDVVKPAAAGAAA